MRVRVGSGCDGTRGLAHCTQMVQTSFWRRIGKVMALGCHYSGWQPSLLEIYCVVLFVPVGCTLLEDPAVRSSGGRKILSLIDNILIAVVLWLRG